MLYDYVVYAVVVIVAEVFPLTDRTVPSAFLELITARNISLTLTDTILCLTMIFATLLEL